MPEPVAPHRKPGSFSSRAPWITRRALLRCALWWLGGCAGLCVLAGVLFLLNGAPIERALRAVPRVARAMLREPWTLILGVVPGLGFWYLRGLVRAARRGRAQFVRAFARRVVLPAVLLSATVLAWRQYRNEPNPHWQRDATIRNPTGGSANRFAHDGKQRGVNFVAGRTVTPGMLEPLVATNVEWLTVVPYGFQAGPRAVEIRIDSLDAGFSESDSGIVALAAMAHARGLRIALKPQLWMGNGRSLHEIDPGSAAGWDAWFASYERFLVHYARLAARTQADLLCVGAELHRSVQARPQDWRRLIAQARREYPGPMTYGANWSGEVTDVSFWDALDFVGVQAYYPLVKHAFPSTEELVAGWLPHADSLAALSAHWRRPILFTEVGWKSTADAAIQPWVWTESLGNWRARVSTQTQARAYDAFFQVFWDQPWFAGAHFWKWYSRQERAGGPGNIDFTPQNKPAEDALARGFGRDAVLDSGQ